MHKLFAYLGFVFSFFLLSITYPVYAESETDSNLTGNVRLVSIEGQVEILRSTESEWKIITSEQTLTEGDSLRTDKFGRAGLLLEDGLQIRIGGNSTIIIKTTIAPSQTEESITRILLKNGTAWFRSQIAPTRLEVETPSGTAAIRGTELEISVTETGKSTVKVLHGTIEFRNELGTINISEREQGIIEIGSIPSKLLLTEFSDRIQWVTTYELDPLRYITLADVINTDIQEGSVNYLVYQAATLMDKNDWAEAEKVYQKALQLEPEFFETEMGLGYIALAKGEIENGLGIFERLMDIDETSNERVKLGAAAALIRNQKYSEAERLLELVISDNTIQPAAYLLLAELSVYAGDTNRAVNFIKAALKKFPNNPKALSCLAKIYLVAGQVEKSRPAAEEALLVDPASTDALIIIAEIAYLNGNYKEAEQGFNRVLTLNQHDDRALYGLARINSDIQYVSKSRSYFTKALEKNTLGPGYHGSYASLLALADDLDSAQNEFITAIDQNSNDYVAITGEGLLKLKQNNPKAALDSFLKAQVIEPRYARAYLYAAVAHYQLGNLEKAMDSINKAKLLDPKDPLPGFIASIFNQDMFNVTKALNEALTTLDLLPNLKSLDQLVNDKRGTANLGSSFAFFGLENWAQSLAHESYDPFWAGSHLFLSDRYTEDYLKNSELFQGYLTDPMSIGASNRFQSIYSRPESYITTRISGSLDEKSDAYFPQVTINGYTNVYMPIAYFVDLHGNKTNGSTEYLFPAEMDIQDESYVFNEKSYGVTAAAGIKPSYELSLFAVTNYTNFKSKDRWDFEGGYYPTEYYLDEIGINIGTHYKFSPDNQIWFKFAFNNTGEDRRGESNYYEFSNDKDSSTEITDKDRYGIEIKHGWTATEDVLIISGLEYHLTNTIDLFEGEYIYEFTTPPDTGFSKGNYKWDTDVGQESWDGYISMDYDFFDFLSMEAGLYFHHSNFEVSGKNSSIFEVKFDNCLPCSYADTYVYEDQSSKSFNKLNPRIGFILGGPDQLLRLAYQRWTRPDASSTLAPVSTAGIPLQTQLVQNRGTITSYRVQADWRLTDRLFTYIFYDYSVIDNQFDISYIDTYAQEHPQLELLRNLSNVNLFNRDPDGLEFEPLFGEGEINSFKISFDALATDRLSLTFGYRLNTSRVNESYYQSYYGYDYYRGNDIPAIPRHAITLGGTYISPKRITINAGLFYRSQRFFDEENFTRIEPSWDLALRGFWETRNKRFAVDARVDVLLSGKDSVYWDMSVEESSKIGGSIEIIYRY